MRKDSEHQTSLGVLSCLAALTSVVNLVLLLGGVFLTIERGTRSFASFSKLGEAAHKYYTSIPELRSHKYQFFIE